MMNTTKLNTRLNVHELKAQKLHPLFSSKYRITHEIAEGGNGVVMGGTRNSDTCQVAVKFLSKKHIPVSAWVSFEHDKVPLEVYILRECSHPSIVNLLDYFDSGDFLYIVMEQHGTPWMKKSVNTKSLTNAILPFDKPKTRQECCKIPLKLSKSSPSDLFE